MSENPVRSASELIEKLAKELHHHVSAAQNLEWEVGDTCDDCREDVKTIYLPIIRAHYVRQQSAPDATERMECGHLISEASGHNSIKEIGKCRACERETALLELAIEMGISHGVHYARRLRDERLGCKPTPDDVRKRYEERR